MRARTRFERLGARDRHSFLMSSHLFSLPSCALQGSSRTVIGTAAGMHDSIRCWRHDTLCHELVKQISGATVQMLYLVP